MTYKNKKDSNHKCLIDNTSYYKECNCLLNENNDEVQLFLKIKGIELETANRFMLGHRVALDNGFVNSLLIPINKYEYINMSLDDNEQLNEYSSTKEPFNKEALYNTRYPVFITKGALNAISIEQMGYPALSVDTVEHIKQIDAQSDFDRIKNPLILAFSLKEKEDLNITALEKELDKKGIFYVSLDELFGPNMQANDCLSINKNKLKKILDDAVMNVLNALNQLHQEKIKEYEKSSVSGKKENYLKFMSIQQTSISTGYSKLDQALNGGLAGGRLYTVGAISSLGKTTFINQMAEYISSTGNDVIYIALEMSEFELNSKGISRHTYINVMSHPYDLKVENAKTSIEVDKYFRGESDYSESDKRVIRYSIDDYFSRCRHLYIYDTVMDVKNIIDAVKKHIEITGKSPVVIIDYLQIMPVSEKGLTDKANMDSIILSLKQLAREYNVPVVVISSFNRQNYTQQVNMTAFKESGSIEYSSDVVIGIQFSQLSSDSENYNELNERAKEIRYVDAVILKNRNGMSGISIHYAFYAKYSYFYELQNV